MGLWAFLRPIDWVQGPLIGFHRPWRIVVTSLVWWGPRSAVWGRNTLRCHAHGPSESGSTYSGSFCLDYLAACPTMSACPLSAWGLDLARYLRGWNFLSFLMGFLISFCPFNHSFKTTSFLCPDNGGLAFVSSLARPSSYHRIFGVHVFRGFVQRFNHRLWVIFVKR